MFDWPRFLSQHNIEYVESGPSTAKGNVYVHCVLCGSNDNGHHLGISLLGKGWGCWRNKAHRGRHPAKLVQTLLKCSWPQALEIVGSTPGARLEPSRHLAGRVRELLHEFEFEQEPVGKLAWPKEFRTLTNTGMGALFFSYLRGRGYTRREVENLTTQYDLRYVIKGPYRYRVVIPVYDNTGLVTFVGRAVDPTMEPRYRVLSANPEKAAESRLPQARAPITDCLFNERELHVGGRGLIVVEGPFDAMRLDFFGEPIGIRATCFFGKRSSLTQFAKLAELSLLYDWKVVVLDQDATLDAVGIAAQLFPFGFTSAQVPEPYKDAAELPYDEVMGFLARLACKGKV